MEIVFLVIGLIALGIAFGISRHQHDAPHVQAFPRDEEESEEE